MSKYKVAVYAICKNEAQFVNRWVDSMREADGIFVCDTGSEDATVKELKKRGVAVKEIRLDTWRFDTARNLSLDFVPADYDICVCTDLDEVFEAGWRAKLESVWTDKTTQARYHYTWSFKPDGTPDVTFYADKIHARHGFRWVHPVHEVLRYVGDKSEVFALAYQVKLNHYPDAAKSRAQYLPLLELSVREEPNNDRNMHYLGREYMFHQQWDKCIETLQKHLNMKTAVWRDERSASMRFIARAYRAKGDEENASVWLWRAIAEAPYLREPYAEAVLLAYAQGDWLKAYYMVNETLKIATKPKSYISEGFAWDGTLYDIGSVCAFRLGLYERAVALGKTARQMAPDDERIAQNLTLYQERLNAR